MRPLYLVLLLAGTITAAVLLFTAHAAVTAAHRHLQAQALQVYLRLPAAEASRSAGGD